MSKSVIAIDIDEVLSPLHEPFLKYHNAVYGSNFEYPDPQGRYYVEQFTGETSEVSEVKIQAFVNNASFQAVIVPLPGAIRGIKRLKQAGYKLVIVTGRQPFYQQVTDAFLNQYFAGMFDELRFIPHSAGAALKPAEAKLKICREFNASYLVDDNLSTVIAAAEQGLKAVLFGDYHWNKHTTLPSRAVYCKDWPAVEEYFDGQR